MDYRSLADIKINAFRYIDILATKARITGPTYESVLISDVRVGDALLALEDAVAEMPGTKSTTRSLLEKLAKAVGRNDRVKLSPEIDLGPYAHQSLGEHPRSEVGLSALSILTATARLADPDHQVAAAIDLDVPSIASLTAKVTVGERAVSSGWMAVGRPGATASTAQARLMMEARIAPAGLGTEIRIPIYVDAAKAEASLSSLRCARQSIGKQVTLDVKPSVVEAWIGSIPDTQWHAMRPIGPVSSAVLAQIGPVKISGSAHARMGNAQGRKVTYSSTEIDRATVKTVSTSNFAGSLTASLIDDLEIEVAGSSLLTLPLQKALIADAVAAIAAPLDATLYAVLAYLGVGIGEADAWVEGVRCDDAVLVH